MTDQPGHPHLAKLREQIERGGAPKYHEAAAARGKMFARDRIALLTDDGSFTEDGRYANAAAGDLPADGVITGTATIDGRPVALMANDSTVKAGSWGARTVEKIIRIIEKAYGAGIPMVYLVDSAGARITDQVEMFPGRRGAGKIFHTQVRASGAVPQVCALFGPSAAGGAYIPAFCDYVAMVDGNASMYLGSPRMVEMVVKEKTTLEEMGGARMHCSVSGCGHYLAKDEPDAIGAVRRFLSYLPANWEGRPPAAAPREAKQTDLRALVPVSERQAYRHAQLRRGTRGRGVVLRGARAVGAGNLWSGSAGLLVRSSASWPTTRCSRAACSSWTPPTRRPGSSSSATRSTCRCSSSPTSPDSWWAPRWRSRGSSGTAPR